ncbi:acyl-CoA N-acyltransferase [Ramicandelaber brevisporus]|nr:acyl-CoA N-acyltransferase [Ramicandelaber brevisporus]
MTQQELLFDSSLISPEVQALLPPGYILRPLASDDNTKGYLDCLANLTIAPPLSAEHYSERFQLMKHRGGYYIVVIENTSLASKSIVACGTVLHELKFYREMATCAHIEDIVVSESERGKKFGLHIINQLKWLSAQLGCYKVILNCNEHNVGFYEKCGLTKKDVQMTLYHTKERKPTDLKMSPAVSPKLPPTTVLSAAINGNGNGNGIGNGIGKKLPPSALGSSVETVTEAVAEVSISA